MTPNNHLFAFLYILCFLDRGCYMLQAQPGMTVQYFVHVSLTVRTPLPRLC